MIISELTYPTNMKFLDFVPKENAPRNLSFQDKVSKSLKDRMIYEHVKIEASIHQS